MSINGQDPRSNVYLLDGTPQNDFTNGPAGSAAGTVLGVETIREFRVEANSYGAEFGRNSGGQIMSFQVGSNEFHGSLYLFIATTTSMRATFSPGEEPEFNVISMAAALADRSRKIRLFFAGYESLRKFGTDDPTVVPDVAARSGNIPAERDSYPCETYLDEFPLPTGNLGGGLAESTSVSTVKSPSTSLRAASTAIGATNINLSRVHFR